MVTKEPTDLLLSLPEDVQQILLAVSVVWARIDSLPQADQNDLFKLTLARSKAVDDDERRSIHRAMIEILTNGKSATHPLTGDCAMQPGTQRWAQFVGKKIRLLREQAGMTQTDLAKQAGLPQSHISRIENAEHSATHKTLNKIAHALGVTVGDIDPVVD